MERVENLLRFALAPGIGCVIFHRLIEAFGTTDGILGAKEDEVAKIEGVRPSHLAALRLAREIDPRPEMERVAAQGITLLAYDDPRYPRALRTIYDPPFLLYLRGELQPVDDLALAIVGTRYASRYGREQAERFADLLARAGFTIVSGLARGIDTSAHRGALGAGGRTLAVLGCGLGHFYPPENRDLGLEITERGAILSEFPMDVEPSRETFPRRNRIIAGLAQGVLVVEAPERSGALITARYALEMGREVFAIPGRIDQPESEGCHQLIREGATLVRRVDDILEELGPVVETLRQRLASANALPPAQVLHSPTPPSSSRVPPEAISSSARPSAAPSSTMEATILQVLTKEPIHIDHLCEATGIPMKDLSSTLLFLELKRAVKQLPGKFFVKA